MAPGENEFDTPAIEEASMASLVPASSTQQIPPNPLHQTDPWEHSQLSLESQNLDKEKNTISSFT